MARQQLYLNRSDQIEKAIRFTCRRHRCSPDEADEFAGAARLALLEDDCAILASFEGRSSLPTFLTVVLQRLFLDFRIRKWGKWRPSAEAKRLGPLAVRLETLRARDGLTLDEAARTLQAADPEIARDAVDDLVARLPPRTPRRFEGTEALDELASPEAEPEAASLERERAAAKRRATVALGDALAELPAQDRLILRLRFGEGRQVVEIAAALRLEPRPLYRRIEALAAALRRALAARGVSGEDFGWPAARRAAGPVSAEKRPAASV